MLKYIWKLTGSEAEACESEDNVSVPSIDDPLSKITGAQVDFHTRESQNLEYQNHFLGLVGGYNTTSIQL